MRRPTLIAAKSRRCAMSNDLHLQNIFSAILAGTKYIGKAQEMLTNRPFTQSLAKRSGSFIHGR